MLGYSESDEEVIYPKSILYRLEDWGMGRRRSFQSYMHMVGLDVGKKTVERNDWCHHGKWPDAVAVYKENKEL